MIYLRGYFATCCVRIVRHIVVDVSWDSLFKVTSVHSQELGINKCKKDHPSENYFWITFEGSHNAAKMSRWVWTLLQGRPRSSEGLKDRAHLSTFKTFIFEKFSCFIVLVVFLVIVQSSELVSVWFCEKMTFFPNFFSYHIFAIYVGGASLGLPTACRLIAVSGARLPSVDGLVVRCIKMHHHVKSAITICLQFI